MPAHRILVVSHEVGELKRLLDFLEENFNGPASLVEIANRTCRPNEVVGDEGHVFGLSIDFDDCLDQTQSFRIPAGRYQTEVRCPVSLMTTSRRILSLGALCCPTTSYFMGYATFVLDADEVDLEHPIPPMQGNPKKQVFSAE